MTTRRRPSSRLAEAREELAQLQGIAERADEAGSFTAAVQAVARVGFLRQEIHRLEAAARLARLSESARLTKMADMALREGSYVSAQKLVAQGAELRLREAAEAREAEIAARASLSPEELLQLIVDAVRHLSPHDVAVVREALDARAP